MKKTDAVINQYLCNWRWSHKWKEEYGEMKKPFCKGHDKIDVSQFF
jgi:hypothetical protein